jgi:hypothetical protein
MAAPPDGAQAQVMNGLLGLGPVFTLLAVPADGLPHLVSSLDVSAAKTFFVMQQIVCRDAVGLLFTILRRCVVAGGAAPAIASDVSPAIAANGGPVNTLALALTFANAIVGTSLDLSVTNPVGGSVPNVTVYYSIYAMS